MKIIQISVTDRVIIEDKTNICEGNVNSVKFAFSFSDEWQNLEKVAMFKKGNLIVRKTIIDNECCIPIDILNTTGVACFGVYGYMLENEELVLRESPACTEFIIKDGSYKEPGPNDELDPSDVIDPTDFDRFVAIMNEIKGETETIVLGFDDTVEAGKEEIASSLDGIVEEKTEDFNNNAIAITNTFNSNAAAKIEEYNENSEAQTRMLQDIQAEIGTFSSLLDELNGEEI